jgi:hypothetical protein
VRLNRRTDQPGRASRRVIGLAGIDMVRQAYLLLFQAQRHCLRRDHPGAAAR